MIGNQLFLIASSILSSIMGNVYSLAPVASKTAMTIRVPIHLFSTMTKNIILTF